MLMEAQKTLMLIAAQMILSMNGTLGHWVLLDLYLQLHRLFSIWSLLEVAI